MSKVHLKYTIKKMYFLQIYKKYTKVTLSTFNTLIYFQEIYEKNNIPQM